MKLSDFDFELPEELIALRPAVPRDSARLLVVRGREGQLEDRSVRDLPELLNPGDILVANDTRVLRAALLGRRPARGEGGDVEIEVNLNSRLSPFEWSAFARPGKRLKEGDTIVFANGLMAIVIAKSAAEVRLGFNRAGDELDKAIDAAGNMPIPPYIASKRPADEQDSSDYQTLFARETGSVAAPTAGLHFTPDLLARLDASGIARTAVTLHVNAGTFLPVKVDDIADHKMHAEHAELSAEAARAITASRASGGRCIPVGTTALRTLESAAAAADPFGPYSAATSIFMTPGYKFRVADGLMTNFHLPKSTLFMLVSAMMGLDVMKRAYAHAVRERYRFFSYGDACLLLPNG
ncbi:MAG: tRNA preQ1(34) S-adenosylmethionine ribosyltransferase-isomerase QueA [Hyphomonadaceae bacterium]|nr:tRNA preQ1(34) S-adenosylmethionine ribosyltransferase-isomerase QueA [Hyphomonadaceae bacterium]